MNRVIAAVGLIRGFCVLMETNPSESRISRMTRILSHWSDAAVGWVERDITENSAEKITSNFTENPKLSKTE